MTNSERARKTAEKIDPNQNTLDNVTYLTKIILSALDEAAKETREDMLRLLSSTDETVALHSEFTGKYRGI